MTSSRIAVRLSTARIIAVLLLTSLVQHASAQVPASATRSNEQVSERLRTIEEQNRALAEQLERSNRAHDEQIRQLLERYEQLASPSSAGKRPSTNGDAAGDDSSSTERDGVPDYMDGVFAPYAAVPDYYDLDITSPNRIPLIASFGPGFQLQSSDEMFRLQIHYESQVEGRMWGESGQNAANSGIYLPRQRIFFNGNITKPVEYEFAINRGLNNINLLNAFINLHFDDRFEIRFGRFFTPIPYDQYAISNYWLLTPERSLFTTNVGLNRQFGLMGWGYLFDKRLDYAAGVFNGSRNSFENLNNAVDFVGYINARPFQNSASLPVAQFLNIGSSVAYGYQDESPVPVAFRIGAGSPDANIPGPATVPFLILNPGVVERGDRLLGSVHVAYFYRSLSLIGEWQYGFGNYANVAAPVSTLVPFSGYYVAAGYFLTGEEVERRTRVKPRRPFVPLKKR